MLVLRIAAALLALLVIAALVLTAQTKGAEALGAALVRYGWLALLAGGYAVFGRRKK